MLKYDILKREESVIMLVSIYLTLTLMVLVQSTLTYEILVELLVNSLTTILFLHALA